MLTAEETSVGFGQCSELKQSSGLKSLCRYFYGVEYLENKLSTLNHVAIFTVYILFW